MTIIEVLTVEQFDDLHRKVGLLVSHFEADWAPQCKQITDVLTELAQQPATSKVVYCSVKAEDLAAVSQRLGVTAVPTVVVTSGTADSEQQVLGRVDGARPADIAALVRKLAAKAALTGDGLVGRPAASSPTAAAPASGPSPADPSPAAPEVCAPLTTFYREKLQRLVCSEPAMLFIKGTLRNPKCGFSRTAIDLLNSFDAQFTTFDILTNDNVREGLKELYEWPTYPQLYVKGELVGGLDIMKELNASGELAELVPIVQTPDERLKKLTHQAPLMVFMKGDPSSPQCGFSRTLVQILQDTKLPFDSFDILTDDEVRQGLKKFSNWPTYPQVYVKGELIGGLDIIKEMREDGSLLDTLKGE